MPHFIVYLNETESHAVLFITGTLFLQSGVGLEIEEGALQFWRNLRGTEHMYCTVYGGYGIVFWKLS